MRSQIIASIEERISAYTEEIEKNDFEISSMQQRIEEIMALVVLLKLKKRYKNLMKPLMI